ncbi:peptide-N4-asparagine amidase [Caulobacter sp. UNC279MFTsu5.1]|uniref:peptide-N4-asparagine amidase n=1 Tax=Caulobacter sp. UNC279MFTsu5.1 TaxID=1502775 RepID=UPI0008E8731F|nr:peptide-N4-asparagine amidase [Caulobacter sp. UNC279MFTsu5.1]SFJ65482.1 Peptide N-acetyl-beta-D-glucosaminyl asparaginase amidase A [Caulobacter sp. UNC279MFTsu5.1]
MLSILVAAIGLAASMGVAQAGGAVPAGFAAPPLPAPGVNTVAEVEPRVPRPPGEPCVAPLFGPRQFEGVDPVAFAYAPPAACRGPWAKVVLEADFDVTAGRQFDRTAIIHLGGVNLYYGTTMEPRRAIAPTWHVERDVTDYAALLAQPGAGEVLIANVVNETYTGRLTARARLLFYPASASAPAPAAPQVVQSISDGLAKLTKDQDRLTKTVVLPTNVERLALDVVAQGQADDEFWYDCVPDALASDKEGRCGGGAFRQVEVFVDGQRAGLASLFPWIFTGGINPYLWFPAPAPETLNFTPSRIDLTPFAGLVNDGRPHRIEVTVPGVRNYYLVTASLLAWRDAGASSTSGRLLRNTLAAPRATTDTRRLRTDKQGLNGRIDTRLTQGGEVAGVLRTSHGEVATTVRYAMSFSNRQDYVSDDKVQIGRMRQSTRLRVDTRRKDASGTSTRREVSSYPFSSVTQETVTADGTDQTAAVDLTLARTEREVASDGRVWTRALSHRVAPTARGQFNRAARRFQNASGASVQQYRLEDSAIGCYGRTVVVKDNAVVTARDGC